MAIKLIFHTIDWGHDHVQAFNHHLANGSPISNLNLIYFPLWHAITAQKEPMMTDAHSVNNSRKHSHMFFKVHMQQRSAGFHRQMKLLPYKQSLHFHLLLQLWHQEYFNGLLQDRSSGMVSIHTKQMQ